MKKQIFFRLVVMLGMSCGLFGQTIQSKDFSVSDIKKINKPAYNVSAALALEEVMKSSAAQQSVKTLQDPVTKHTASNPLQSAVDVASAVSSKADTKESVVKEQKTLYVGSPVSSITVDEDDDRRFLVIGSVYSCFCSDTAFDGCRQEVPLAQVLFTTTFGFPGLSISPNNHPKPFTIGDIFLESRLSQQGKMYLDTIGPTGTSFGNVANEQYLSLLAPVQVQFYASQKESGANATFMYRFFLGDCDNIAAYVGLNVPVICRTHELELELNYGTLLDSNVGGICMTGTCTPFTDAELMALFNDDYATFTVALQAIKCPAGCPNGCCNSNQNTIAQFFGDFNSVEDFFIRGVLAPKGIELESKQQKIGFGDISLVGSVDFAPGFDNLDALQFGVNLSIPVSGPVKPVKVWPISLGNNAFALDLFSSVIVNGGKYCNPAFYLTGSFFASGKAYIRAPRLLSSKVPLPTNTLLINTGVLTPVFKNYFVMPFSEVDTLVSEFADTFVQTRNRRGSSVIVGVGNYFQQVLDCKLRLAVFYDFMAKGKDNVCILETPATGDYNIDTLDLDVGTIKTTLSVICKTEFAHRISWHAAYKLGSCGEVMVGSQHIVTGKNVTKSNQGFVTFVCTF
ncbi:MAG: hypothetical protein NTX86_00555 [Candidatus Dependentiae bacterium]|nr:hypothetical protein [Candidatus Dependentiae bacterium]